VRLCLDASASLGVDAHKLDSARRVAAAIGYLALASSERAQVLVLGGREDARRAFPTHRGRAGIASLLRELASVDPHGALGLPETLAQLAIRARPPGALVVVSDFLDPDPLDRALARARAAGHDVHLVQVLSAEELAPSLEGDLTLVDVETGAELAVSVDASALAAYERRLDALFRSLAGLAKRHRGSYVRVAPGDPLDAPIRRFVARSID
jgi:uncharacterized protein (DUF58 family)